MKKWVDLMAIFKKCPRWVEDNCVGCPFRLANLECPYMKEFDAKEKEEK